MLSDKKILVKIHRNSLADFFKKLDILIKNQTHHKGKLPNDVSNFFIYDFGRNEFYKALMKPYLKNPYKSAITCSLPLLQPQPQRSYLACGLLPAPMSPIISMCLTLSFCIFKVNLKKTRLLYRLK